MTSAIHIPVFADYAYTVPEPSTLAAIGLVGLIGLRRRR